MFENVVPVALSGRENVDLKPELLFQDGIHLVCAVHVLVDLRDGHEEVKVKVIDDVVHQAKKHNQRCILKISQLYVHGPEFYSPADRAVERGGRLEPH